MIIRPTSFHSAVRKEMFLADRLKVLIKNFTREYFSSYFIVL
jgi:hypothetical protein